MPTSVTDILALIAARRAVVAAAYADGVREFANPHLAHVAVIGPDASKPGRWRVTWADAQGAFGHSEAADEEWCLRLVTLEGFYEPAPGLLDALTRTPTCP